MIGNDAPLCRDSVAMTAKPMTALPMIGKGWEGLIFDALFYGVQNVQNRDVGLDELRLFIVEV